MPITSKEKFPNLGQVYQTLPDVTLAGMPQQFKFELASGDFVKVGPTANGQSVTALSIDPITDNTQSIITVYNPIIGIPHQLEIEASMSQRTKGDYAVIELVNSNVEAPTLVPIAIASIQQATTTLTIVLSTAVHDLAIGDWINIYGVTDTRFNYCNAVIGTITADKLTLSITVTDDATITSLTAGPVAGQGFIVPVSQLYGATDGYGMRFTGTSSTSAAFLSKFGNNETMASGTFNGSQVATSLSTTPVFTAASSGQYDVRATTRFAVKADPQNILFMDRVVDTVTTFSPRILRSAVKPSHQDSYKVRFRAVCPKSMTRPIAKIVSAVRAGSTTVTVTTDVAHGLTTGNYVTCKGARDYATNFVPITTPVAVTVTGANTFTLVWGSATTTVTSYGGSVHLCHGSTDQQGMLGQVVQSAARNLLGQVTLIGSATWSGTQIGEFVNLYGCRADLTGADLLLDGVYEVVTLATTTMVLKPVVESLAGQTLAPVGGVINTTNCGGVIIQRTTLRAHDILIEEYTQHRVQIDGAGTSDTARAIPVQIVASPTVNQGSPAAISTTSGSGGWFVQPAVVGLADIASAAITTTATTAAVANSLGNGFQVNIAVTAATGTTPTMDVRIEESFDGGTNWVTLYEFQRITATGSYNSPIMRATGRHIRYVRTIAGTTPSFTMAVVRNVLPFIQAEPQKRLMDRSIVLTTLNSVTPTLFQGAANNVQLIINLGAATTPPAVQIEGSEDGANWYAIGSPLTGVASNTVQLTVVSVSATYTRARVSTAGVTVTAGYVSLKAWS